MIDRAYKNLSSEFLDKKEVYYQIKNDETRKPISIEEAEWTEQDSQVHKSNLGSGGFIPNIATDTKIAANIINLNKKSTYGVWCTTLVGKKLCKEYFHI